MIDYGHYIPWAFAEGEGCFRIYPASVYIDREADWGDDPPTYLDEAQSPEEAEGWAIEMLVTDTMNGEDLAVDIAYPEGMVLFTSLRDAREYVLFGCAESDARRSKYGDHIGRYIPRKRTP